MNRRRHRLPEEPRTEALNMTPMIDVVFQLLIFFMLSMHFREVEGKLISQLPKKGTQPIPQEKPELLEIRVVLRADGDACLLRVEGHPAGAVYSTERHPERAAANRALYRAAGEKIKELYAGSGPVILSVDRKVPYEHVVGIVNACKAVKIERIEFAAVPPR